MSLAEMHWSRTTFVHYRASQAELSLRLPHGLELDRYRGQAFVSLVAVDVIGPLPTIPCFGLERLLHYRQLNLRTYVVGEAGPGILLLDTQVNRRLPVVGARLLGMPYRLAAGLRYEVAHDRALFESGPLTVIGQAGNEPLEIPAAGTVESFLLDRYWVYGQRAQSVSYAVHIDHPSWRVRPLKLRAAPRLNLLDLRGQPQPVAAQLGEPESVQVLSVALPRSHRSSLPRKSRVH